MSGIFGVVSDKNCISALYYGTDYHSHLGTAYGGISYINSEGKITKKIRDISNSQFKSKFYEGSQEKTSRIGIGAISDKDAQPLIFESKFGTFAICTAGLIENMDALADELIENGVSFSELRKGERNQTELVAKLLVQKKTIVEGIEHMFRLIEGSVSLILMTQEGVYCARDRKGVTPLVIGKRDDGYAAASESCSFANLGYKVERFLDAGEIVMLGGNGAVTLKQGKPNSKVCAFYWIYTGFPASSYEGINVQTVRENCGRCLAKNDDIKADVVAGVPDSGSSHAMGYAMESGIPFRSVLFKYTPGYGRSYTPLTQDVRDQIALMKLIACRDVIKDNSIVLCEDSIVRGTQLKNYTIQKLKDAGANEIHVRSACPPLMYPCKYQLSTRKKGELITRKAIRELEGKDISDISEYLDPKTAKHRNLVEWIRKDIGVTTLRYQLLSDMVKAIGLPKERICTYCWTGEEV